MKEKVEFRQIREFGAIISDTFLFIKQNFAPLLKTFFTICGLFIVASMISMALQKMQANYMKGYPIGRSFSDFMWSALATWEYALLLIISMINYVSMYVTVLSFISVYIQKGNVAPTTAEVWAQFKVYYFRMLGSNFILLIFMLVCFAACLLPGLYVFPAVTLFYPIMILEDASFSTSFSRSFKLLKDEWWMTAVVIFVVYIILYMMYLVITIPLAIVTIVGAISHTDKAMSDFMAIISAAFTSLAQVFMVIPIIASALIYFNLVERKENSGLLDRINTLGQQPTKDNSHLEEY